MKGKIQTVLGLINPDELGPTLIHEHILCDVTPPGLGASGAKEVDITLENVWEIRYHWQKHLGNGRLDNPGVAIQELERFRSAGGQAIVDQTCIGMKRDPLQLRHIARSTKTHVIMGSGYYTHDFLPPEFLERSAETIANEIIGDFVKGVDDTGIRSGIIGEIGCSYPWMAIEKRVMRASVMAQQATGAAISVHPGRHPRAPFEALKFIEKNGGSPGRTIVDHVDRTIFDLDTLLELAQTGCMLEYDFFGIESSYYPFQSVDLPNDGARLRLIRDLIDRGHLSQVLISHDICTKTRLATYGGHGYSHIFRNIVPMMRNRGFTEDEIMTVLCENPRRVLTFV